MEQARGIAHVHLDEQAREVLRELFLKSKNPGNSPPPKIYPSAMSMDEMASSKAAVEIPRPTTFSGSKREQLDHLRLQAASWAPAFSLGTLRTKLVFSAGNPEARIMLIGEAPGYQEEETGEPFVGPAGQKLTDILKAMGLSREEVYLSNIVKFRPATARQTTNNRKPTPEEVQACLPIIQHEIRIIQPECLIALGPAAAEALLKITGSIGGMRGVWHSLNGVPTRVTHHPSHLLQTNSGNSIKREIWEDMLAAMDHLKLPISAKQRGYFQAKA